MGDEDRLFSGLHSGFLHPVHQRQQGGPPAPGLADGNQPALIVHVEHGLDGEHGAKERRGGADPSAPLEVVEIIHRKPVADASLGIFGVIPQFLQRFSCLLLQGAQVYQQPLSQRGAQGVHH